LLKTSICLRKVFKECFLHPFFKRSVHTSDWEAQFSNAFLYFASLLLLLCHVRYLSHLDPATEFIKLRSTPFKDGAALVPKLADLLSFWKSGSTPLYTGSGILDPDWLIFYTIYTCQLYEINYLETRSCHFNTSFIIIGFQCLNSDAFSRSRQS
jgi:hypothetical protein